MKPKVLVVDDEALIRAQLVAELEDQGYPTTEAANAAEAIEVMEKDKSIRIVFTDIEMPGTMDGMELAHYVRSRWPPTFIVICSGRLPEDPSKLPARAKMLGKPFHAQDIKPLFAAIEQHFGF